MIKAFFASRKWALWAWGGLTVLLSSLWLQVSITVMINEWYGGFYDLMQNSGSYVRKPQEGIALFYQKLQDFCLLAITYFIIATINN